MSNLSQFILCKLNIKDVVKFRNMNFKKYKKKSITLFQHSQMNYVHQSSYPLYVKDAKNLINS